MYKIELYKLMCTIIELYKLICKYLDFNQWIRLKISNFEGKHERNVKGNWNKFNNSRKNWEWKCISY